MQFTDIQHLAGNNMHHHAVQCCLSIPFYGVSINRWELVYTICYSHKQKRKNKKLVALQIVSTEKQMVKNLQFPI